MNEMNTQSNNLKKAYYKGDALIVGLVILVIIIFAGVVYALIDNEIIKIDALTGKDDAITEEEEDPYANRTMETYTTENIPGLTWKYYNNWTFESEESESTLVEGTNDISIKLTDGGVVLSFEFFPISESNFPSKCYDQGGINYVRLNDQWVRITTQTGYVYSTMLYDEENDETMFNQLVDEWKAAGNEGEFVACGSGNETASAMMADTVFGEVSSPAIINIKMSVDSTGNNTLLNDADEVVMELFD